MWCGVGGRGAVVVEGKESARCAKRGWTSALARGERSAPGDRTSRNSGARVRWRPHTGQVPPARAPHAAGTARSLPASARAAARAHSRRRWGAHAPAHDAAPGTSDASSSSSERRKLMLRPETCFANAQRRASQQRHPEAARRYAARAHAETVRARPEGLARAHRAPAQAAAARARLVGLAARGFAHRRAGGTLLLWLTRRRRAKEAPRADWEAAGCGTALT